MLKMTLKICGKDVKAIKEVLEHLSNERLEANCYGTHKDSEFDYDFVKSDDLYSNDLNKKVVNPE